MAICCTGSFLQGVILDSNGMSGSTFAALKPAYNTEAIFELFNHLYKMKKNLQRSDN